MQDFGVILVNLGTPNSYGVKDVGIYLKEFLMDSRVIDMPWITRSLLVKGVIVPKRVKDVAAMYKELWIDEGSPLKVYLEHSKKYLTDKIGSEVHVDIAMRYQEPNLEKALEKCRFLGLKRLLIFPLFPQYASATTGSVIEKAMEIVKKWEVIPEMRYVSSFFDHPKLIEAFCARAQESKLDDYDHVLFSFHGLPQRHVKKADSRGLCLTPGCCEHSSQQNTCYRAQCFATAKLIAKGLQLSSKNYDVCFQSRLGKDPWIEPYTDDVIKKLASSKKRLLVLAPSFVCDCLETTIEIQKDYKKVFIDNGGEELKLVEGLNDNLVWMDALEEIIKDKLDLKTANCL
jgi:protoporphyrin/coproporphyrin ferrochelatase